MKTETEKGGALCWPTWRHRQGLEWYRDKLEMHGAIKSWTRPARIPSYNFSERTWPCQHLDFRLLSYKTVREQISVVLRLQVCGNLLQQQEETNTDMVSGFKEISWRDNTGGFCGRIFTRKKTTVKSRVMRCYMSCPVFRYQAFIHSVNINWSPLMLQVLITQQWTRRACFQPHRA